MRRVIRPYPQHILAAHPEFRGLARDPKQPVKVLLECASRILAPAPAFASSVKRARERVLLDEGIIDGRRPPPIVWAQASSISSSVPPSTHWRNMLAATRQMQEAREACVPTSGTVATWETDSESEIGVVVVGDWHWGSWGTDYNLIERFTDEMLATPNLYMIVVGDMEQMAISLRGVAEVTDNMWPPDVQHAFTESWLETIGHKIIAACWDNHSVEREEKASGSSAYARIMSRRVTYFGGIGHLDLRVGDQVYSFAVSHRFRGFSMYNPLHAHGRYIRHEGHDREIIIAGDTHQPGIMQCMIGQKLRTLLNCGSAQVGSSYARRHFSIFTAEVFPMIALHPRVHRVTPYWSVAHWLRSDDQQEIVYGQR